MTIENKKEHKKKPSKDEISQTRFSKKNFSTCTHQKDSVCSRSYYDNFTDRKDI